MGKFKDLAGLAGVLVVAAACTSPTAKVATTPVVTTVATSTAPALPGPAGIPVQNRALTPGDTFPGVTAAQVCGSGYATGVRAVSSAEKTAVFAEYHTLDVAGAYEVDHLISLELGGSNSIKNLWPEPYAGLTGAHAKDKVENVLHADVCAGRLSLQAAQTKIAVDWWNVPALDNPTSSTVDTTAAETVPVAAPVVPVAVPTTAMVAPAIVCSDGYLWPSTVRQGACHGHHGIG